MEVLQRTANRGSVSTGYDIDNSVKLEADNTESLTRSAQDGGDRKKVTISFWTKRTELTGSYEMLLMAGVNGSKYSALGFQTTNTLDFHYYNSGSYPYQLTTNRVFRDASAWYHIVIAMDTTQGTAANRLKMYINGVQETSFSHEIYPDQNIDTPFNNDSATYPIEIGNDSVFSIGGIAYSGYLAEYHLVDGSQLAPTDFGEFDDDSGIWIPKAYTGSHSTNGFYLDFADSGDLGDDESGNGNDFTEVNIAAADQATDTPTNNFCTLNPVYQAQATKYHTVSNGGTFVTGNQSGTAWDGVAATIPLFKGKWYWEIKKNGTVAQTNMLVGVGGIDEHLYNWRTLTTITTGAKLMFSYNGGFYANAEGGGFSYNDGDIISIALDQDNGGFYLRKNGAAWTNSGDPASGSSLTGAQTTPWGTSIPGFNVANNVGGLQLNFGGFDGFTVSSGNADANGYGNFEYAPPSGYYAICTKNLAEYG